MMINGKPGEIVKGDAHTVLYQFPEPYYMLPDVLAGSTPLGGQAGRGSSVWVAMPRRIT